MKTCSVECCDVKFFSRGYCRRHYKQFMRNGKITVHSYNRNQPNGVNHYGSYIGILLYRRDGSVCGETYIEKENYDNVRMEKWFLLGNGYAACHSKETGKIQYLHHAIMGKHVGKDVDHVNGDKLDNRIENLRICSHQENTFNSGIFGHNTTGTRGVSFEPGRRSSKKWTACIAVNRKNIHLGAFMTRECAENARAEAEKKYFGKFAPTICRGSQ